MKSVLIRGSDLENQSKRYLADSGSLLTRSISSFKNSKDFYELYKICLASKAVLTELDSPRFKPALNSLHTISLRIPLLVAAGQSAVVKVELRRFVELTFWTIYFTNHPIEWQNFSGTRGTGFSRDTHRPITFAAHRELNAYMEYAREYMEAEPSGVALKALNMLEDDKNQLNSAVHAGEIARAPLLNVPVDPFSQKDLKRISALVKRILGHSIVLIAAFDKDKFDHLPAGPKAYFDWLIGASFQKKIRLGPFGLISVL